MSQPRSSSFFTSLMSSSAALACVLAACSVGTDHPAPATNGSSGGGNGAVIGAGTGGGTPGGAGTDAAPSSSAADGGTAPYDAGSMGTMDGGERADAGVTPGVPGYLYVGRFDGSDPKGARMAWPGTSVIATFDGTGASVTLSQSNGFSGGPSWFNVVVDGMLMSPFSITGTSQTYPLASGLPAGTHTVEIQKRTEANLGTVRFEGMKFDGGAGLLPPPAHKPRRIEFLTDSTIDGYGVEGDRNVTCTSGAPPQFHNARKSMSFLSAQALGAEMMLTGYSGKGVQTNNVPGDTDTFPKIFPRALPELGGSMWPFAEQVPDAVVVSLGGADLDGLGAAPAGFQSAYDGLVGAVRAHYPNAYIWMLVWSEIKDEPVTMRAALLGALQSILASRKAAGDDRLFVYVFPEADVNADETGCQYHANASHHAAMSTLLVTELKSKLGW